MLFFRLMKRGACLFLLFSGLIFCTDRSKNITQKVVIKVAQKQITAGQFSEELARRSSQLDPLSLKDPETLRRTKKAIVADIITQEIIEIYARKNNLIVKKEDLEAEINTIRQGYPDDESFRQALAEKALSMKSWSSKLRRTLLQRLVSEKVSEGLEKPSEQELLQYFEQNRSQYKRPEQVKIRQIVLSNESDAQHILDELKKGKDFRDLAKSFSITPEGFSNEGQLSWISRGMLEVFDQAFFLKKGQRSQIIQSPYGYHIIELLDKRPSKDLAFKEVQSKIEDSLFASRKQAFYSKWLESQLSSIEVFQDDAFIDSIKIDHQLAVQ